jgi:hypothetical protein
VVALLAGSNGLLHLSTNCTYAFARKPRNHLRALAFFDESAHGQVGGPGGTVALTDGRLGQAVLMGCHRCWLSVPRSSFAGFRFPPDVIVVAVRSMPLS